MDNCEHLASLVYQALLSLGDNSRVMGPQKADVVVSVYTYANSDFFWVSMLPRGAGLVAAKSRIDETLLLRNALNPRPPSTAAVTHRVHAEEGAFSLFEASHAYAFQEGDERYPLGSVVGTWHMHKAPNPKVGQRRAPCQVDTADEKNRLKNNRACEVVTEELEVSVRTVAGDIRTRPAVCGRGLTSHKEGGDVVACPLPRPKQSTRVHLTTLRTVRTAPAGTRTHKGKPTATGAVRQRPTHTKLHNTKPAVDAHQKPTKTRAIRPVQPTKAPKTPKTGSESNDDLLAD